MSSGSPAGALLVDGRLLVLPDREHTGRDGRGSEARSLYGEARRGLLDRGVVFDAALVAIDMATILGPDDPDALVAAADARPVLERLGARPFLTRLDAALAREPEPAVTAPA